MFRTITESNALFEAQHRPQFPRLRGTNSRTTRRLIRKLDRRLVWNQLRQLFAEARILSLLSRVWERQAERQTAELADFNRRMREPTAHVCRGKTDAECRFHHPEARS